MYFKRDHVFESCFSDLTEGFLKEFYSNVVSYAIKLSSEYNGEAVSTGYMFEIEYGDLKGYYLYGLATLPNFRKQGRMTELLNKAENIAKNNGADFMFLATTNRKAESLYNKHGFKRQCFEEISDKKPVILDEFKLISLEDFISESDNMVSLNHKGRKVFLNSIRSSVSSYKGQGGYFIVDDEGLVLDYYPKTKQFKESIIRFFPQYSFYTDRYSIMVKHLNDIPYINLADFILY